MTEWQELIKQYPKEPVTYGVLDTVVSRLMDAHKEIASLQQRIDQLETKQPTATLDYQGTWTEARARSIGYQRNQAATLSGSLWICRTNGATSRPGSGTPEWTLSVKRGTAGALNK